MTVQLNSFSSRLTSHDKTRASDAQVRRMTAVGVVMAVTAEEVACQGQAKAICAREGLQESRRRLGVCTHHTAVHPFLFLRIEGGRNGASADCSTQWHCANEVLRYFARTVICTRRKYREGEYVEEEMRRRPVPQAPHQAKLPGALQNDFAGLLKRPSRDDVSTIHSTESPFTELGRHLGQSEVGVKERKIELYAGFGLA
jgi:hypothetical protein